MMTGLLLLTLLGFQSGTGDYYPRKDGVFFQEGRDVVILDPRGAVSRRVLPQTHIIAVVGDGFLMRDHSGFHFVVSPTGKKQPLPEPPTTPLRMDLPWVFGPAFFSSDALHVFQQDRWHRLEVPIWYDFSVADGSVGAVHGLVGRFPHVTQLGKEQWLIYQPKSGETLVWQPNTGSVTRERLEDDRQLVRIGNQAMWLGLPNDKFAALVNGRAITRAGAKTRITGLNRYSPLSASGEGLWLIGFSDGWRDMMSAWKTGRLDIHLNYLHLVDGRPVNQVAKLTNLPLALQLTTSNSGSPRTKVQPGFAVVPVFGIAAHIGIVENKRIGVFRAGESGAVRGKAWTRFTPPALILYRNNGFLAFTTEGEAVSLESPP